MMPVKSYTVDNNGAYDPEQVMAAKEWAVAGYLGLFDNPYHTSKDCTPCSTTWDHPLKYKFGW